MTRDMWHMTCEKYKLDGEGPIDNTPSNNKLHKPLV